MRFLVLIFISTTVISNPTFSQNGDRKGHDMSDPIPASDIPPSPLLSLDEASKTIRVQDGFSLDIVASEPHTFNPVHMAFDGNGRMWVCEMKTYMPDVDATNEESAGNCISLLEDTDQDGKIDKRTVFLDNIILPRAIAHVRGGILYADHTQLYFAEVLDDLTIGLHEVVDKDYAKGGSLEHKPNGMLYGMDNWHYNAKSDKRYKTLPLNATTPIHSTIIYQNKYWKLARGTTEYRGQWGLSMDDYGRLYHNGNGSVAQGEFLQPNALNKNPSVTLKIKANAIGENKVYPIRINPGINRGYMPRMLVPEGKHKGKLVNFTAASGNAVYRGNNFPDKFYGISITPEPAANLISARYIHEKEGTLSGSNLYEDSEILASTDERFRPVNLYTAPDGSLYILDMYHGILQHKVFVTSYLRRQILSRSLDKGNNNKGRIYRLRWTENTLNKQPNLITKTVSELVNDLSHPNGWWRDTARRLIIEKDDKSIASSIQKLIETSADHKVKINALWTLHGLDAISLETIKLGLSDKQTKVKTASIAVSDKLSASDKTSMTSILSDIATADYEIAIQTAIHLDHSNEAISFPILKDILEKYQDKKHVMEAIISGLRSKERLTSFKTFIGNVPNQKFTSKLKRLNNPNAKKSNFIKLKKVDQLAYKKGETIFNGKAACFGCHGKDGLGIDNMGPTLSSSDWVTGKKERLIKVLLHGLSGPIKINGKDFNTVMIMPGMANNPSLSDDDLAAVSTYIRNNWGNKASPIKASDFEKARIATKGQSIPYTANDL